MVDKLKLWSKYAIGIIICVCAGFIVGYIVRSKQSTTIEVGNGTIIERTNSVYKPIISSGSNNNCDGVIGDYNRLLSDYNFFINAIPRVYNVTEKSILFSLATQKYSLDYKAVEASKWSLTVLGSVRASYAGGLYVSYGGGCIFDYSGFGMGILLDTLPSVTIMAAWRGITWK